MLGKGVRRDANTWGRTRDRKGEREGEPALGTGCRHQQQQSSIVQCRTLAAKVALHAITDRLLVLIHTILMQPYFFFK